MTVVYDFTKEQVVKDVNQIIQVATTVDEAPATVFLCVPRMNKELVDPSQSDVIPQLNLELHQYVRLDRLPEPLKTLVKDLLDVKA